MHAMKIAVVTDDGQTISRHFGRAALYAVVTVEDGAVVGRELRSKSAPHRQSDGHVQRAVDDHDGPAARDKHTAMVGPIGDCTWVVAGGMGRGAYTHITAAGLRPVVTTLHAIDEAAIECAAGRIVDHAELLH
jgi:predicted Fe-Mo cluster-binding NifX family protein